MVLVLNKLNHHSFVSGVKIQTTSIKLRQVVMITGRKRVGSAVGAQGERRKFKDVTSQKVNWTKKRMKMQKLQVFSERNNIS